MTDNNCIPWTGGECPIPKGTLVTVRYSTASNLYIALSDEVDWSYVIAYRIYEPPIVAEPQKELETQCQIFEALGRRAVALASENNSLKKAMDVAKEALELYAKYSEVAQRALKKIAELENGK